MLQTDKKNKKKNMIALQNIVMDINESTLQVSEEFLDKITKIYISKRMSLINSTLENMAKIRSISLLCSRIDAVMAEIDELIKIEPYYVFNDPVPTKYKELVAQSEDKYINNLITREWRTLRSRSDYTHGDRKIDENYREFLDSFVPYYSRLTPETAARLAELKQSVFPPESEKKTEEEAPPSDEFVEEKFPTLSPDQVEEKNI
ncbi:MAG: hypothetical protein ACI4SF_16090 [Oscillospiraceae bacterium]